ncbi:hypothetical protein D3C77_561160 [compost metagenome]
MPPELSVFKALKRATSSCRAATRSLPAAIVTWPTAISPVPDGLVPTCWPLPPLRSDSLTVTLPMEVITGLAASVITAVVLPVITEPSLSVTCTGRVRFSLSSAP